MRTGLALAGTGLFAAAVLWPQAANLAHRDAYRAWREADPALEAEATQTSQLATRGAAVWQAAAKYGEARRTHLRSLTEETAQLLRWIDDSGAALERDMTPAPEVQAFVRAAAAKVSNDISVYAGDNDRGIQQLRQALERERSALTSLNSMIATRQSAAEKAAKSAKALEPAIASAHDLYQDLGKTLTTLSAQSELESATWGKYYDTLVAISKPEAAKTQIIANVPAPEPVPAAAPVETARVVTPPPPRAERAGGAPPVPLTRYIGEWFYPTSGGLFHGLQPESVDLAVREQNGLLTGTLAVRFKPAPGNPADPDLRFSFSGDLKPARNQLLTLETSEGAKGVIELIPGGAFNLLEVNFQTEPFPDKIRLGNFVLVKK